MSSAAKPLADRIRKFRLRTFIEPAGRTSCVQKANAFCRTGFQSPYPLGKNAEGPTRGLFDFLAVQRVLGERCSAHLRAIFSVMWEIYREFVTCGPCAAHKSAAFSIKSETQGHSPRQRKIGNRDYQGKLWMSPKRRGYPADFTRNVRHL